MPPKKSKHHRSNIRNLTLKNYIFIFIRFIYTYITHYDLYFFGGVTSIKSKFLRIIPIE